MSLKYILFLLLTSVLVLVPVTGCKESKFIPVDLVPQGANLIANVQISKIVNDRDIRDAYDKFEKEAGQPRTAEEGLDELVEETGIDIDDFSQAVVFADTNKMERNDYIGFIAEGDFNEKRFINNIEDRTGERFSISDYKGYK